MAKKGTTKAVAYAFEIVKGRRVYARDVQRALTIRLRQFDHSAGLWQDRCTMPRASIPRCAKGWDPDRAAIGREKAGRD